MVNGKKDEKLWEMGDRGGWGGCWEMDMEVGGGEEGGKIYMMSGLENKWWGDIGGELGICWGRVEKELFMSGKEMGEYMEECM